MTVEEFEAAFQGIDLPEKIRLDSGVVVTDVPKFISSHITALKGIKVPKIAAPYIDRLNKVLEILQKD